MSGTLTEARAAVRAAITQVEQTFAVGETEVWEELRLLRKVEASLTERLCARRVAAQARAAVAT